MSSKIHEAEEAATGVARAEAPVEVLDTIATEITAMMLISRSPARSLAAVAPEVVAAEEAAITLWKTTTALRLAVTHSAMSLSLASRYSLKHHILCLS